MRRKELTDRLEDLNTGEWDFCIIGGGATGLGTAVDAASRGYKTILLEKHDFAKGTSSRSTKLVHGGVRYLQQGNIKLVMEALRERGILKQNAPHLVKDQSFIVPNYKWWEGPYYGLGLKVYDWMAGTLGLGASEILSTEEILQQAPTLDASGLRGGVLYHDGQFDDARLAVNLAQTAIEQGAIVLNYFSVNDIVKVNGKTAGVTATDTRTNKNYLIKAKAVINATGVFSDSIQQMDEPGQAATISPSQGIHIVLDKSFLPGNAAIMIPHTDDGRVLFAVPWHNRIIVGTTDTPVSEIRSEPMPTRSEIDFLLEHASRYLTKDPVDADIKSVFSGLRALVKSSAKRTAEISRDHSIVRSASGLISILGGKWTTYRKMAQDVVDFAAGAVSLEKKECITRSLPIHGHTADTNLADPDYYYGSDRILLKELYDSEPGSDKLIHPSLPYTKGEIIFAVRNEYCHTVEDALSRRTRALLLDTAASIESAPEVARIMAAELKETEAWIKNEIEHFNTIAETHLPRKIKTRLAI